MVQKKKGGERGVEETGEEEQGMKMLPKKSKNCLEPAGKGLIRVFFLFGEAGLWVSE